jgi:hypothetical protein
MTEQTARTHKPFEGKISEETRQHLRTARAEFHKSIEGLLPPGFTEHHRNARKERCLVVTHGRTKEERLTKLPKPPQYSGAVSLSGVESP